MHTNNKHLFQFGMTMNQVMIHIKMVLKTTNKMKETGKQERIFQKKYISNGCRLGMQVATPFTEKYLMVQC